MRLDAFMSFRSICILALLIFPSVFVIVPMTSGQTFITVTTMWTTTEAVTLTSTNFTEFSSRTVTTVKQVYFEGRLAPAEGSNNCSSDHYPLPRLGEGVNVQFSFESDTPMDLYLLSESTFSAWASSGARCDQIMNSMVEQVNVNQLSPRNFTIPSTGDYEVLVVNTSSNAWGDYVVTLAYPTSTVESQSSAIFLVTTPTTIIGSYVLRQPATLVIIRQSTSWIINLIPILIIAALAVLAVDLLRREVVTRRKKPAPSAPPPP